MSAARMTVAEARRLGLLNANVDVKPAKVRVRRTAKGPYHTVCTACDEEFLTQAAEDHHLEATKHGNYRLVLGFTSKGST